ncbi:MAG: pentapeptide repeat-containing protein, partial [Gammaproteobacteria bacterium]
FDVIEDARTKNDTADFTGVVFPGPVSFEHFTAEHPLPAIQFIAATFSDIARFDNATFSGVWFENATFSDIARFDNATFSSVAWFENATFSSVADFSCSPATSKTSSDIALAHDAFGHLSFKNATFDGRAIFTNRKFTQPARFSGGHFTGAPEFYGCALHQGTTFLGRDFLDTGKHNVDAVSAYRTLKLAMESLRDRSNEAKFFAFEQVALRTTKQASRLVRLLSLLYSVSSNYRQSIGRPLLWLALTTLASFLLYAWLLDITVQHVVSREALERTLRATLEPLFNPFGAFRPSTWVYPFPVQLLMLLQSLLSLVWITLFLLALRRRFKLD